MESNFDSSSLLSEAQESDIEKQIFTVEAGGQQFEFTYIPGKGSSDATLVHLPGFGTLGGGGNTLVAIQKQMEQTFNGLALTYYQEPYSSVNLTEALTKAINMKKNGPVVLHGNSFGTSVVYDLITNEGSKEFIQTNDIRAAVLETPVLDKTHLSGRIRALPDRFLQAVAKGMGGINRFSGGVSNPKLDSQMLKEALRSKVSDRKIMIPVFAAFTQKDKLIDNESTKQKLQSQSVGFVSETFPSAEGEHGHHPKDYALMRKNESEFIKKALTY